MKNQTILITLAAIIISAITPITAIPQTENLTPNAPTSFSVFSLPQNIGMMVNSADNESGVSVAPNGLSLYFSSNRSGTLGSIDLWVSQRPTLTSAWGTPQNLMVLNTDGNENLPALSPDGKTLFFSSSRPGGFGSTDIYMATRSNPLDDFGWTAPVNLGVVINTPDLEWGAGYFEDPTNGAAVLYFSSNRAGGLGESDIYQSTRNANGTFNAPTNVAALNSSSLDRSSSVRRDGLEIFFESDRDGGRDIWVSSRASLAAPWNPPVNLAAVNSDVSDQSPSLSADGAVLYFSSGRDGSPDIYTATRISVNRTPTVDFDGDGRTDISIFRPSDGSWWVMQSGTNTVSIRQFGTNGDRIVPGDYDGDGRTDMAVYRSGVWWIMKSSDSTFSTTQFGLATDKPVPADYDGDGRTDIAVYRNGNWYILQSSNGQVAIQQFGLSSDIPIAGVNVQ